MSGLPRSNDASRPQDAFNLVVLRGIENLTYALMKGEPFSARGLADMQQLRRRLEAFDKALTARLAEIEEVTE